MSDIIHNIQINFKTEKNRNIGQLSRGIQRENFVLYYSSKQSLENRARLIDLIKKN